MSKIQRKTLLLVEDEALIALAEKAQLERYGYVVKTVATGEHAIEELRANPEIDLVLMDINLGDGIDGTETAESILGIRDIPIVFLSSHTEREIVERTENITSYGYVVKNSSATVIDASIKMAFKLFEEKMASQDKEKLIYEHEEKFRLLHMYAGIGIGYYNLAGVVLSFNQLAAKHMGGAPEDFIGKSIFDLFPKPAAEEYIGRIHRAARSETPDVYEDAVPLPNGTKYFLSTFTKVLDANGRLLGIQIISQDITDRKTYEAELVSQKTFYEHILEQSLSGYWDWDIPTGEEYLSPAFKRMFGYEDHEIENNVESWQRLIFAEDLPRVFEKFNAHVESEGRVPFYNEVRYHHKDGSTVWVICTGKVIEWDDDGKAKRMIGCHIDITERKRIEEELKESEDRFKALHNASFGGIAIHDRGIILECNKGLSEMTGYSEAELSGGMDGLLLLSKDSRDYVRSKIASGYEKPYEAIGLRKNGVEYPVRLEARNVLYKGKQVRVVEFRDLTEQKRIEKELRKSEERFRNYVSSAPDGIILADENGRYVEVNKAACEITGYSEEELLLKSIADMTSKADLEKGIEHFTRVRKYGSARGEFGFIAKSGETRFWNVAAVKLSDDRFLAFTKDITEQRKVQSALKEQEEKYRFALEGSNLGEWDWGYKTGNVTRNRRWAEMLGYSPDELLATLQQGVDLMHPDDYQMVTDAVAEHIRGIVDHYYIEYRLRAKGGDYKWIRDCGKIMVRDEEGKPVRICGTHEDIDERKRARDKIDSLLAEKELILKEVHHRIKNNMNTVSSLLSLQADAVKDDSAALALQDASNRIKTMSILYDKLYRSLDYTELSLKNYLTTLIEEVIANFPNGRMVSVELDIEDFILDAKRLQLLGIIINELLTNVMKYAFKGGKKGMIRVSASRSGGRVAISVKDDGIGIPESVGFDRSTGFGLQLVDALALQLGGAPRIERGNGTKVIIEFDCGL